MVSCASCAESSALIRSTSSSANATTLNASPCTRRKWKSRSRFKGRRRKLVEFASTLSGRKTVVNSASASFPTAITASASSASERGDKQSSSTTKSFVLARSVERVQTLSARAASGSTIRRRKNSSSRNTNQRSARKIANTSRR